MKRLFVSDLDGTLLNSKAEISDITARIQRRLRLWRDYISNFRLC